MRELAVLIDGMSGMLSMTRASEPQSGMNELRRRFDMMPKAQPLRR